MSGSEIKDVMPDGSLKVRLKAAPADGKANSELITLLSCLFKVPPSSVKILTGLTSRLKRVMIEGVNGADAAKIVAATIGSGKKRGH